MRFYFLSKSHASQLFLAGFVWCQEQREDARRQDFLLASDEKERGRHPHSLAASYSIKRYQTVTGSMQGLQTKHLQFPNYSKVPATPVAADFCQTPPAWGFSWWGAPWVPHSEAFWEQHLCWETF